MRRLPTAHWRSVEGTSQADQAILERNKQRLNSTASPTKGPSANTMRALGLYVQGTYSCYCYHCFLVLVSL